MSIEDGLIPSSIFNSSVKVKLCENAQSGIGKLNV